jgi:RNA polymerase sigma-70 factor (ECF subfamily)
MDPDIAGLEPRDSADPFVGAWTKHRSYLLNIAYRLVGSMSEAEDLVQEAYARLLRTDPAAIDDLRGWLVVVVSRLCLDHLRSARVRRESTLGPWFPEPFVSPADAGADPADVVILDESVRMALLIVLEQLSPAERAVFVLHDVFQFSFEEVAPIVERTPAACRQLASRARRHIHGETRETRPSVDPADLRRVAERFISACSGDDMHALLEVLDPEVVGWADLGGTKTNLPLHSQGAQEVAAGALALFGPKSAAHMLLAEVNGETGIVVALRGRPFAVLVFQILGQRISAIYAIADRAKLGRVRLAHNGGQI